MREIFGMTSCISSYNPLLFKLLLVDVNCICMRTGSEVHPCTVSLPCTRKLHKLIHLIQIFMRKNFAVQHYPQNIFNIDLSSNCGL